VSEYAAGTNDNGQSDSGSASMGGDNVDITNAMTVLGSLFFGGPAPPLPFPDCGGRSNRRPSGVRGGDVLPL